MATYLLALLQMTSKDDSIALPLIRNTLSSPSTPHAVPLPCHSSHYGCNGGLAEFNYFPRSPCSRPMSWHILLLLRLCNTTYNALIFHLLM